MVVTLFTFRVAAALSTDRGRIIRSAALLAVPLLGPHVFVVAYQEIQPGTELKISYGPGYWEDQDTIMNFCALRE